MPTRLLDLNVLIALAWPNHVHHTAARTWFQANSVERWATCVIHISITPRQAIELLRRMTDDFDHVFWQDNLPVSALEELQIQGHRQVTDAYLLALYRSRHAQLATLDAGIRSLLPHNADQSLIHLVPA